MNNIKKTLAMTLIATSASVIAVAQETVVKGFIVNQTTGQKFAGARIINVGTESMTMSEDDGSFELKVDNTGGILQIEAPGYDMQYVPIQGRKSIKILMAPKSHGEQPYNNYSLSASSASSTSTVSPAITSADQNIQLHQMADIRSTAHSGLDAGGSTMFFRGLHSINMTSQPLFIVDGQIWQSQENTPSLFSGYNGNPLALISPDDIESITIMKNGTAIWGAKAAGGVVVIETKRSHNMATEIEVNMSLGIKEKMKAIPMMDAYGYRIYATDIMKGITDKSILQNLKFTNDELANNSAYYSTHQNTDWNDQFNSSAVTQKYGVSVRGGDDIALYSFSLGYSKNDGNIKETSFDRLNVRFNSDISLTKNLKTRADISFSQITRNIFDDGINEYTSPIYLSYIKSPLYSTNMMSPQGETYPRLADTDELGTGNPLAIIQNAEGKNKNYRFNAILAPTYRFSDRFSLSGMIGFSWDKIKENNFTPDYGLAEMQFFNNQGEWYGEGKNSVASLMMRHSTLTFDINGDWNIVKVNSHNLSFKGGFRYINDTFESDFGRGYNTGSDDLRSLSVTNPSLRTVDGLSDDWRSLTWYAKVDYGYLNRYLISATATMETNSRFGRNAEKAAKLCGVAWGVFPSVTGAWIVSNEKFMNHVQAINYLKIHAGYDVTGRDDLLNNASRTYFNTVNYIGLAKGLQLANIGNDRISWERTGTFTAGFDALLFNNRLSVGFEYFNSKTDNLLVNKQLREEFGLKSYWTNDGELKNSGFNISISGRTIDTKDWTLNIGATMGHYKNKVTRLAGGAFNTDILGGTIRTEEGQPLGVFYGYKAVKVFATQEEADAANLRIKTETGREVAFRAGDIMFDDHKANGIIDEDDRQIIGDPNPDIYGNFNLCLRWRNLTLDALFTYQLGADAYNALRSQLESGKNLNNQTAHLASRWTADGQQTDVPRATYGDPMGNSRFSDRWIEDASYLKLSQLSLSYKLPVKPRFIQGLTIWTSVNNVFTVTKYLGADPEFSYGPSTLYQGIDAGLMPPTRSYNIGIKLNL